MFFTLLTSILVGISTAAHAHPPVLAPQSSSELLGGLENLQLAREFNLEAEIHDICWATNSLSDATECEARFRPRHFNARVAHLCEFAATRDQVVGCFEKVADQEYSEELLNECRIDRAHPADVLACLRGDDTREF